MAVMEKHFVIYTEYDQYRIRPNPDAPSTDASEGIVIETRGSSDEKWEKYFFIAGDAVPDLVDALQALMNNDV